MSSHLIFTYASAAKQTKTKHVHRYNEMQTESFLFFFSDDVATISYNKCNQVVCSRGIRSI